jgi:hypothetical protein
MGQLIWTYGNGVELQSDRGNFRLTAGRATVGTGYRYAVTARDDGATPLASGSRESLREAIEAAEQAVGAIDPTLALAS